MPAKVNSKLIAALKEDGIQVDRLIKNGVLLFMVPEQTYLAAGKFDPETVKKLLATLIQGAMRKGFSGFRAAGDMGWALSKKPGCNRLLEYETLMETFFPVKPAVAMCTYRANQFPAAKLRDLLAVHHFALMQGSPGAKRRTVRIHSGMLFGDVTFDGRGSSFHCRIQRKSGELVSLTEERTIGTAFAKVKRQLHELRPSILW